MEGKKQKGVRIHETGGVEKLRYEEFEIPKPEKNQILIKNEFGGINYIDTYHRSGIYTVKLPFVLGRDGAGVVAQLGDGVSEFKLGDRVAYASGSGSYAEYTASSVSNVIKLPDSISFEQGVAAMITGLTTHYLVKDSYCVKKGDVVLVHASAGALGQALVQICKHLGAFVIGTVSTEEKAKISKQLGCDEVINYSEKNFEEEVKRITNGKGCNVVYDSVGKNTFFQSLNCCAIRGCVVLCGNASGKVDPFDPLKLSEKSLTLTRPALQHFVTTREEFANRCNDVFKWMETGVLQLKIDRIFPLSEADKAQTYLESRKAMGKLLLKVKSML